VNESPAIVSDALRALVEVFADTESTRVPGPTVEPPDTIVTNDELVDAVQLQLLVVEIATDNVCPAEEADSDEGERLYEQVGGGVGGVPPPQRGPGHIQQATPPLLEHVPERF
jgi:hypothetical protein